MPNKTTTMNFKTKYNLKWSHVEDLQATQENDQPVSLTSNDGTSDAKTTKPVGANYIPVELLQLSGKNVSKEINVIDAIPPASYEVRVKEHKITEKDTNRRLFKKNGIIYDLLN